MPFPTTRNPFAQAGQGTYGLNSNGSMAAKPDSSLVNAYSAASLGVTPVATPTDFIMVQGSATNTIRIKRITLQGVATAAGNMPVNLIRRSTQFTTQGTAAFTAVTLGNKDTLDPAATAVVSTIGTANVTSVGTAVATLASGRIQMAAVATGVAIVPCTFNFFDNAIVLRGASDFLFVNLNGAAVPAGGVIDFTIDFEEDNS